MSASAEDILREAIEDFLIGDYPNPRSSRPKPCRHGAEYYNECALCDEEHFTKALAAAARSPSSSVSG